MTLIPGPRTHPTVKSLAQTNQRSLRSWQISLGALQVSLLLGGIIGSLACAFYLGFFSGQKIGIEMALSNNLSSAMRLPIGNDDETPLGADEGLTDVYAKLNQLDSPAEPLFPNPDSFAGLDAGSAKAKPSIPTLADQHTDSSIGAIARALEDNEALHGLEGRALQLAAASGGIEISGSESAAVKNVGAGTFGKNGEGEKKPGTLGALALGVASKTGQPGVASDSAEKAAATLGRKAEADSRELAREESAKVAAAKEQLARENAAKEMAAKEAAAKKVELAKAAEAAKSKSAEAALRSGGTAISATGGLIRDTLPRGWFAQVAAPDNRSEAEALARKLQKSGFSVMIENAKVRGQEYFRVLVGPEETRQQSERLLGQLKREPGLKADPFIRMVR